MFVLNSEQRATGLLGASISSGLCDEQNYGPPIPNQRSASQLTMAIQEE